MEATEHETIELAVERMAYRGLGVAHAGSVVCFVPETCPGEKVEARVVDRRKNFWNARVLRVIEPSPDRLASPDCRMVTPRGVVKTPGCVYDHMTHEAEVRIKNAQLLEFLERQAGITDAAAKMSAPAVSPKSLHYRNKTSLHSARDASGERILGYIGDDNETAVDVPRCPLSDERINAELAAMRGDAAFWRYVGVGSEVVLRCTESDGVAVYVNRPGGNERHASMPPLTEKTPVLGYMRVPVRGFWQMNPEIGGELVSAVAALVAERAPSRFIDLYCGVGVFALSAARLGVKRVFGADSGRDVVRAAEGNARHFALDGRARFECCDVGSKADRILSETAGRGAMALVDPPRAGLDARVVSALLARPVRTLVYVSCAPDTLARDLRALTGSGVYRCASSRLFDMFPRTAHFESLTVLESV